MTDGTFSQRQYEMFYPKNVENHFFVRARHEIIWKKIRPHISKTDVLMDIGCGPGIFVNFLRDRKIQGFGCDKGKPKAICESVDEFLFLGMNAEDVPYTLRKSITFLMLIEVLEHLSNPSEFLSGCLAAYPSVTKIMITVPARQELYCDLDLKAGHLKRYTLDDAIRILDGIATKRIELGYFFHMLYLPSLVFAKTRIEKPVVVPSAGRSVSSLLHKLLAKYFVFEAELLPGKLPGTTIYCMATLDL